MISVAIKKAILRTTGVVATEVFASTDQIAVEMADLSNEVAADIMKAQDWRALTKIATVTGSGADAYALPDDFDRMTIGAEIDDAASWFWGYESFETVNDWMRFKSGSYATVAPGGWIILGGELQFFPAPNGVAQYPYISNAYAKDAAGNAKSEFTSDSDTFVLDNRLLTLGLIWRWMAQKKMDYSEDLATYEMALAQAQGRDKGARILRTPSRSGLSGRLAYSGRAIV